MKVFNLRCELNHSFEGWFASSDEFERQLNETLVRCPLCDSESIQRIPSATHLNMGAVEQKQGVASREVEARWMKAVREVLRNTEDVGERFAEEARRIHYHEATARAIRGVASSSERAALAEEGIEVIPVPIPSAVKGSLQ